MEAQLAGNSASTESWQVFENLDTTRYSLLHRLFGGFLADEDPSRVSLGIFVYLSFILVTLLPLSVTALFDLPTLTDLSKVKLPFLYDGNVLCLLAVSLPLVGVYIITDQPLLRRAVASIIRGKILTVVAVNPKALVDSWNARFGAINLFAQVAAVVVGLGVARFNYDVFSRPNVGYWTLKDGQFSVTGWVYLYCIFLFYWTVSVYVVRTFSAGLFLRELVNSARVSPIPLHPDHCGGLRPVGVLGLRTQYMLMVLGINLLFLIFLYPKMLGTLPAELKMLIWAAAIAYVVLGPIIFVVPLLPFRGGMMRSKAELMDAVAQGLKSEFERVQTNLQAGPVSKEDEDTIERLRKMSALVEELPVWPFDALTLRKFATAYLVPVVTSAALALLRPLLETLFKAS
jgi:hypothetical protein